MANLTFIHKISESLQIKPVYSQPLYSQEGICFRQDLLFFISEASQLKETRQNILHHLLGEESVNTSVDLEFSHVVNKKLVMKRAFLTPEDEAEEGRQKIKQNIVQKVCIHYTENPV